MDRLWKDTWHQIFYICQTIQKQEDREKSWNEFNTWLISSLVTSRSHIASMWEKNYMLHGVEWLKIMLTSTTFMLGLIGSYLEANSLAWHWRWKECSYKVLHEFHLAVATSPWLLPICCQHPNLSMQKGAMSINKDERYGCKINWIIHQIKFKLMTCCPYCQVTILSK